MPKFILLISTFLLTLGCLCGQEKVKWLTFEQALEKNSVEKKKMMVFVETDNCLYCKKMESRTLNKTHIAEYVNDNFYPIKFNAKTTEDIIFNNKIYKYVKGFGRSGYHELAKEIMMGTLAFPTTVFIDENLNVIQPIKAFQPARTFEIIITYMSGEHYTTTPWGRYEQTYKSTLRESGLTPSSIQPTVQPVKNP